MRTLPSAQRGAQFAWWGSGASTPWCHLGSRSAERFDNCRRKFSHQFCQICCDWSCGHSRGPFTVRPSVDSNAIGERAFNRRERREPPLPFVSPASSRAPSSCGRFGRISHGGRGNLNAKGVPPSSPGLAPRAYPGKTIRTGANPNGVVAHPSAAHRPEPRWGSKPNRPVDPG